MREAAMANLSLKNVPEGMVQRLKERARRNRRSLNREALSCLEQVLGMAEVDVDALLAEVDELHASLNMPPVDDEFISEARRDGRP